MTAELILKAKFPGDIFSSDKEAIKSEYRALAKKWHPDMNESSIASEVFNKLNLLYNKAISSTPDEIKSKSNALSLLATNGKTYRLKYKVIHKFELGEMYVADTIIAYSFQKEYKEFYENSIERIKALDYADETMKNEVLKYMPTIINNFETDDRYFLVIKKTDDLFLLRDLLEYHGGEIPVKHVAWILSSLYNITCFFHYNKISHNALTLDNYLVSPIYHSGSITGGWWYTVEQEEKMIGVNKETFKIMPTKAKTSKMATIKTDLESIKLIGRQLLGTPSGSALITDKDIPKPISDWLRGISSSNPFEEYEKWVKVLYESFGNRKFIEMTIDKNDFYQTIIKEEL